MVTVVITDRSTKYVSRLQIIIGIGFIPRRVRDVFISRYNTRVSVSYHHLDDGEVNEAKFTPRSVYVRHL